MHLQEFVEATKENSGLDMGKLGEQPGNKDKSALGQAKTPQGQDVSGTSMLRLYWFNCRLPMHVAYCACVISTWHDCMPHSAILTCGAHVDIMSFSGLLPELINSRAAMFGMLAAFGAELGSRQPLFVQVFHHVFTADCDTCTTTL